MWPPGRNIATAAACPTFPDDPSEYTHTVWASESCMRAAGAVQPQLVRSNSLNDWATDTPQKAVFSMRGAEPLDEELDPQSRLKEYVYSKRRVVAKRIFYRRTGCTNWPLNHRRKRDISQMKEDLEHKITAT